MGSTVFAVTFDCVDAAERPGLPRMMFFAVPEGKSAKNRVHLDLVAA